MWNNINDLNKKTLIDSDVIRHFIKGKSENKLSKIFQGNLFIVDIVEAEICRSKKIKPIVQKMINDKVLKRMKFPTTKKKIRNEYLRLCINRGNGESACMAIAKHSKDIIASNNLRDIENYCITNNILYLKTLDILCIAYFKGIMKESDVDYFLYLNLNDVIPSKIPFNTFKEFLETNPDIVKIFK